MKPNHPFGAGKVLTPSFSSTIGVDIDDAYTVIDIDGNITSAFTVNLDSVDSGLPDGSRILLKGTCGGTGRTLTLGTNINGTTVGFTANKTHVVTLEKYGDAFYHVGNNQID